MLYQAMFDALTNARNQGHIFVAAAGNASSNNDATASYPSNYNLNNVVAVASTTSTDGLSSFEGEPQEFKIAHLRNIYQKVGMFAASGEQIRGFGFLHDGSVATVFNFLL